MIEGAAYPAWGGSTTHGEPVGGGVLAARMEYVSYGLTKALDTLLRLWHGRQGASCSGEHHGEDGEQLHDGC